MVRPNLKTALLLAGSNVLVHAQEDCVVAAGMLSITGVPDQVCCDGLKALIFPGVAAGVQANADANPGDVMNAPPWSMVQGMVAGGTTCSVSADFSAAVVASGAAEPVCAATSLPDGGTALGDWLASTESQPVIGTYMCGDMAATCNIGDISAGVSTDDAGVNTIGNVVAQGMAAALGEPWAAAYTAACAAAPAAAPTPAPTPTPTPTPTPSPTPSPLPPSTPTPTPPTPPSPADDSHAARSFAGIAMGVAVALPLL